MSLERRARKKPANMTKTSAVANSGLALVQRSASVNSFLHKKAADRQSIHPGAEKCAYRVGRSVRDGFTAQVERGIHDDWDAGALFEFIQQTPVQRIYFFLHGLRARAAVNVCHRRNHAALFWPHLRRILPCDRSSAAVAAASSSRVYGSL